MSRRGKSAKSRRTQNMARTGGSNPSGSFYMQNGDGERIGQGKRMRGSVARHLKRPRVKGAPSGSVDNPRREMYKLHNSEGGTPLGKGGF